MDHIRIDFSSSGSGLYHTQWPHSRDQFSTPEFEEALQQFVDAMRTDGPLKNPPFMDRFCRQNGGAIMEDGRSYGYLTEMGSYRFYLRCTPGPGEYQCYLYCYDLRQQTLNGSVGRVTFASGEYIEFTAPQSCLRTIRGKLSAKGLTDFRFETLMDNPAVRKAVDDMVYGLHEEENPRPLKDYTSRQGPSLRELPI